MTEDEYEDYDKEALKVGLLESSEEKKIKFKWQATGKTFTFDMEDVLVQCLRCGEEKTVKQVAEDRGDFNMPRSLILDLKDGEDYVHIGRVVLCSDECASNRTLEKSGEFKGRI